MIEEIILQEKRNTKYKHHDDYFDNINTEAKAYLLGFIIADGSIDIIKRGNCISKRLCFLNSIDDLEIIKLANREISPESNLYYRQNNIGAISRKEQVTLRIASYNLCTTLENKYNIKSRKTFDSNFIFNFNLIPNNLHKDFIRGYFDGDGSVSFYKTNNTLYFNFSFVLTSLEFTNQLGNIFKDIFGINPIIYFIKGKTCDYYKLRFDYSRDRTNKIIEIYNYLYKDANYFLDRKKVKFLQYFEYRGKSIE